MIINKDIKPEFQLYPIGAAILSQLKATEQEDIQIFDLYKLVKEAHSLSLNTFFLALDWLFIIGAVDENNGMIVKCF
jgi:ABC-3C biological conflict system middle component